MALLHQLVRILLHVQEGVLAVHLQVALKVGLVAGAVVTIIRTFIRLFMGVSLDMSNQQSLALKRLVTLRPVTSVANSLGMPLNIVITQIRFADKSDAATDVRVVNFFMHCVLVPLHVISAVAHVFAFGIWTDKRFIVPGLALGRGQLSFGIDVGLLLVILWLILI